MSAAFRRDFWLIAPYAAWMALMAVLPQTGWAYAMRGGATALLLTCGVVFTPAWRRPRFGALPLAAGVAAGIAVFAVWIAPDILFGTGATVAAADSPYSPEVCGLGLTVLKLAASAFVIPAAEELFFRRWLVDFAGFWWMVALFAVEHGDRWHVGALAGIAYGLLAKRYGLLSAIVAHSVTNLVLGLYVILANQWQYW
jgi:hypothetical protein